MSEENGTPGTEIIEGSAQEIGDELAPAAPTTLFRTDDPAEVLERATETANALKSVLRNQGLTTQIQGKDHVNVEGWQTLGAMLGVTPVCTWTRPVDDGWEARVEARTLDGRVIGAAESQCLKSESRWGTRVDDFARRSMAQTRATSKALGSVLRFVVTLAGYSSTPAEEMGAPGGGGGNEPPDSPPGPSPENPLPPERVKSILAGMQAVGIRKFRDVGLLLGSVGIDGPRAQSKKALDERLAALTPEQADALEAELSSLADGAAE